MHNFDNRQENTRVQLIGRLEGAGIPRDLLEPLADTNTLKDIISLRHAALSPEDTFHTASKLRNEHTPVLVSVLLHLISSDRQPIPTRFAASLALQGIEDDQVRANLVQMLDGKISLGIEPASLADQLIIDPSLPEPAEAEAELKKTYEMLALWALRLQRDDEFIDQIGKRLNADNALQTDFDPEDAARAAKVLMGSHSGKVPKILAECISGCVPYANKSDAHASLMLGVIAPFTEAGFRPKSLELYKALRDAKLIGLKDDSLHQQVLEALGAEELPPSLVEVKIVSASLQKLKNVVDQGVSEHA